MNREEILERVAPCSLMCHTCTAFCKGEIAGAAKNLLHYLKGIKGFYAKHMPDAVESYESFEGILSMYAGGDCHGCRSGEHNGCSIEGCFLLECTKEHDVDFCGECSAFPCDKTKDLFEEEIYRQWLEGSLQIKEKGIEQFWEENREKPHYEAYIK